MIVKNISAHLYKFDEFDGLIIRTGDTADLSLFAEESRNNSIRLQEGFSKGELILLNMPRARLPISYSIQSVKESGQTDRFVVYREQQKRLVPITPIDKRLHMKRAQLERKQAKCPLQALPKDRLPEYESLQNESLEYDDIEQLMKSDGDVGDGLKDLYPGFEIDVRAVKQKKQVQEQESESIKQEGNVTSYEEYVETQGVPHIADNHNMLTISKRQPGAIETERYMTDAAVFIDQDIAPVVEQVVDERVAKVKSNKCLGSNRFGKSCGNAPVKGYQYCLGHMPEDVKKHYLKLKGMTDE